MSVDVGAHRYNGMKISSNYSSKKSWIKSKIKKVIDYFSNNREKAYRDSLEMINIAKERIREQSYRDSLELIARAKEKYRMDIKREYKGKKLVEMYQTIVKDEFNTDAKELNLRKRDYIELSNLYDNKRESFIAVMNAMYGFNKDPVISLIKEDIKNKIIEYDNKKIGLKKKRLLIDEAVEVYNQLFNGKRGVNKIVEDSLSKYLIKKKVEKRTEESGLEKIVMDDLVLAAVVFKPEFLGGGIKGFEYEKKYSSIKIDKEIDSLDDFKRYMSSNGEILQDSEPQSYLIVETKTKSFVVYITEQNGKKIMRDAYYAKRMEFNPAKEDLATKVIAEIEAAAAKVGTADKEIRKKVKEEFGFVYFQKQK